MKRAQWQMILDMLRESPRTTSDFVTRYPLAAEYRRAITELRRKGYTIDAERVNQGNWRYRLLNEAA